VEGGIAWDLPAEIYGRALYAYRNEAYDRSFSHPSGASIHCRPEARRRDDDHRISVSLRRPLAANLALALTYLAMINESTVSRFSYDRHIFGIALEWAF
jgi:hypothetical protein